MKYNKINELLVKEAFKPSKHNYNYFSNAEYTFLIIDGCLGLKVQNIMMYVDASKVFCNCKPLEEKSVDRLFVNASSGEMLTATNELLKLDKVKKTCSIFLLPDGQKIYINVELLKYFDSPVLYGTSSKSAVYVKDGFNEFCAIVCPMNVS